MWGAWSSYGEGEIRQLNFNNSFVSATKGNFVIENKLIEQTLVAFSSLISPPSLVKWPLLYSSLFVVICIWSFFSGSIDIFLCSLQQTNATNSPVLTFSQLFVWSIKAEKVEKFLSAFPNAQNSPHMFSFRPQTTYVSLQLLIVTEKKERKKISKVSWVTVM